MTDLFKEGQACKACVKGTLKIVEGTIWKRHDGTKVLLKEDGKYHRLASLTNIRLLEQDEQAVIDEIDGLLGEVDAAMLKDDSDSKVKKAKDTITQEMSQSDSVKKAGIDENKFGEILNDRIAVTAVEKDAEEGTGGDMQKVQNALEPFKQETLKEADILKNYDTIREEALTDSLMTELGGEYDISDHQSDEDLFEQISDDPTIEPIDDAANYIDEDYKSVSDELFMEIISVVHAKINDDEEELRNYILNNYEVTPDDVDDILLNAYQLKQEEASVEGLDYDVGNDEIDDEFESAIDDYEGESSGLLDHLVTEFEIPAGEAERILVECDYSIPRTIIKLTDFVRQRLS